MDYRNDRDELRPVEWVHNEYSKDFERKLIKTETLNGHFHSWIKKLDAHQCEVAYALVEKEDGTMLELKGTEIKFLPKSTSIERMIDKKDYSHLVK